MSQPTEIEITACVRAMVRSEAWSSFWSEEDARKLVESVLRESRKHRDRDGYPLPIDQHGEPSLP
jgi:hypothetical protein